VNRSLQTYQSLPGAPSFTPAPARTLQRACACGQHTGSGGECAECRKKREGTLQRAVAGQPAKGEAPIGHDVLRAPGRPLDTAARTYMESRFGHDFSRVRIHTDAAAAASARDAHALAYTVGHDIVFDGGQYAPQTSAGQRLLAHELTHVVQQAHASDQPIAAQGQRADLEAEADVAAAQALVGQHAHAAGAGLGLMRAPPSGGQQGAAKTDQDIIDAARAGAAARCWRAWQILSGVGPPPPPGRPDTGPLERARARSLARKIFGQDLNMDQVTEIVGEMRAKLTLGVQAIRAPANDPECGNRAAYVRNFRPPIMLCSAFFSGSDEERIRTMIHEAAHLARIGSATLGESYCVVFDCETSCGGFDSADSWAHFVHCLSGAAPDQPEQITGQAQP
jgi:hypothetical protein